MGMRIAVRRVALLLATLLVVAAFASCLTTRPRGEREATGESAEWTEDPDGDLVLRVVLVNSGDRAQGVGPTTTGMAVYGPNGTLPVVWGETPPRRLLEPGDSVTLDWYPRTLPRAEWAIPNGEWGFTLDAALGEPVAPPEGEYVVCFEDRCRTATWEA